MASILDYEATNATEPHTGHIPGIGNSYTIMQVLNLPDSADTSEVFSSIRSSNRVQGICPNDWHIPTKKEWMDLEEAIKDDLQTKELLVYTQYYTNAGGVYETAFYNLNYSIEPYDKIDDEGQEYTIPLYYHSIYDYVLDAYDPYSIRCVKD